MALQIRLTPDAEADIKSLYIHSALDFGLTQARAYRRLITQAVELLAEFPGIGPEIHAGARAHTVKSHRIIYDTDENSLTVLRVLHVRQLPPGPV